MVMQIKALRYKANLTQCELANGMGVEQNTISNWENEVYLPPSASFRDLSWLK